MGVALSDQERDVRPGQQDVVKPTTIRVSGRKTGAPPKPLRGMMLNPAAREFS